MAVLIDMIRLRQGRLDVPPRTFRQHNMREPFLSCRYSNPPPLRFEDSLLCHRLTYLLLLNIRPAFRRTIPQTTSNSSDRNSA